MTGESTNRSTQARERSADATDLGGRKDRLVGGTSGAGGGGETVEPPVRKGRACSSETAYLAALRALPSGERLVHRANRLGVKAAELWAASPRDAAEMLKMSEVAAIELCGEKEGVDPAIELEKIRSAGMLVCSPWDSIYPAALRNLSHPPPLLYYRGRLAPGLPPGVAVVGSRRCTAYGRKIAEELAERLSRAGVAVVSGVARGIDACAHAGALRGAGGTVGVLGCGLDIVYPRENGRLYREIPENGVLVTEYPPGSAPIAGRFPARNRIISGLSRAVVVVEAGEKSGALITAGHGLDQGREVYVVPGSVFSPASRGTHRLLRDGAAPVCSADELLEELGLQSLCEAGQDEKVELSAREQAVLAAVPWTPARVDEILASAVLPVADVLAALVLLEVKGLVLLEPGKRYLRVS